MMQYSASQGYQAPETGSPYEAGQGVPQSSYNPLGPYQSGSQSGSLQGSGMDPYMLDTFGMGQYYQPYGNQPSLDPGLPPPDMWMQQPLQNQMQGPQQPYYQVPTEYIPEGTPGLDQQAGNGGGMGNYIREERPGWNPSGVGNTQPQYQYIDTQTGLPMSSGQISGDQGIQDAMTEQFGAGATELSMGPRNHGGYGYSGEAYQAMSPDQLMQSFGMTGN